MARKINVHLAFAPDSIGALRAMNARLREVAPSLIVFDEMSPHIPHVSLQMGLLGVEDDLPRLARVVEETTQRVRKQELVLLRPYLETARNHYVFCDVANPEVVVGVRNELRGQLSGFLTVQEDYADVPHVTIGHVSVERATIEPWLASFAEKRVVAAVDMEISDAGPKGTCINALYRYPLA